MPGRRKAITTDDVLRVLKERQEPFLSTSEIAEHLGVSKPTVIDRLRTLEGEGAVRSREVAGNTPVWYLPELENRRIAEYTDGIDPQTVAHPPHVEESDASTDGAAPGERGEVRQVMGELEGELRGLFRDVVEEYEEERAREQSEETVDTWGEKCQQETRNAWRILTRSSVPIPILLVVYGLLSAGVAEIPVPVIGTLAGVLLAIGALLVILSLYVFAYGTVTYLGARTGFADWLEQTAVGDLWRRIGDGATD